jgi:hypothetical protein
MLLHAYMHTKRCPRLPLHATSHGIIRTEEEATGGRVRRPHPQAATIRCRRYESHTPVTGSLSTEPCVACRVDDLHNSVTDNTYLPSRSMWGQGSLTVALLALDDERQYADRDEQGCF